MALITDLWYYISEIIPFQKTHVFPEYSLFEDLQHIKQQRWCHYMVQASVYTYFRIMCGGV